MKTRFESPNEKVTVYAHKCSACGEKGPEFAIGELAERWLVAHVSMFHPTALDDLTRRLVTRKQPKPAPELPSVDDDPFMR
jgi:hypothetical protein